MEKIIVYLDDAAWAWQQLAPMAAAAPQARTHWILVGCAPRMTRRIGKWVSHQARENWRDKWADKLFAQITPHLADAAQDVTTVLAKGPLPELTRRLITEHGAAHVLDARRPKFGVDLPPVTQEQPASVDGRWQVPGAVLGMGAVLLIAAE